MTIVKVCGITNMVDARAAVDAGADALGFVFHRPSPRYVSIELAREICRSLPSHVVRIGVFVDLPLETVKETLRFCRLDMAQLHGNEDSDFCAALYPSVVKSLRVGRDDVMAGIRAFRAAAFLLDSYHPGVAGGTGETFDWNVAREAVAMRRAPIILSGGLRPDNVADAVAIVRPRAVDVASGVETTPGNKDHDKLRAFIAAAKGLGRRGKEDGAKEGGIHGDRL